MKPPPQNASHVAKGHRVFDAEREANHRMIVFVISRHFVRFVIASPMLRSGSPGFVALLSPVVKPASISRLGRNQTHKPGAKKKYSPRLRHLIYVAATGI